MAKLPVNKWIKEIRDLLRCQTLEECYSEYQFNLHTIDLINKGLRFLKIENLPDEIDTRVFLYLIFFRGRLLFFKDDTKGYFCLPYVRKGGINAYGRQVEASPVALGNMGNELNNKTYTINENCVEIRANDIGIAPVLYAIYYGEKISNLYDLRDNTNNWLKFPVILKSSGDVDKDKKNAIVLKSIFEEEGMKFPVISDAFNGLELFNIKQQYFGMEIQEQIKCVQNDYYEFLGVAHHEEKKERLTNDEVATNQQENDLNTAKMVDCLRESFDKVNKMFGLNIKVSVNKNANIMNDTNIESTLASKGGYNG